MLDNIKISFELFPTKSAEADVALKDTIKTLKQFDPEFISVTYGAGGSTKGKTIETLEMVTSESISAAGHLTCVDASKQEVEQVAQKYWNNNVKHIVALRGDMPNGEDIFTPHEQGFKHTSELVARLKEIQDFTISVAAFPETHPEAKSEADDIQFLKEKLNSGADNAITQYFFDNELYYSFRDKCAKAGIAKPLIPGLICINNFKQVVNFSKRCKASVPEWLHNKFEGGDINIDLAAEILNNQIEDLIKNGVDEIHIYTLNKANVIEKAFL